MEIPNQLKYGMYDLIEGYSTNIEYINPSNNNSIKGGGMIAVKLPRRVCDLSSFAMEFNAIVSDPAVVKGNPGYAPVTTFPQGFEALIQRLEVVIGGVSIMNIQNYNRLYQVLKEAHQSLDHRLSRELYCGEVSVAPYASVNTTTSYDTMTPVTVSNWALNGYSAIVLNGPCIPTNITTDFTYFNLHNPPPIDFFGYKTTSDLTSVLYALSPFLINPLTSQFNGHQYGVGQQWLLQFQPFLSIINVPHLSTVGLNTPYTVVNGSTGTVTGVNTTAGYDTLTYTTTSLQGLDPATSALTVIYGNGITTTNYVAGSQGDIVVAVNTVTTTMPNVGDVLSSTTNLYTSLIANGATGPFTCVDTLGTSSFTIYTPNPGPVQTVTASLAWAFGVPGSGASGTASSYVKSRTSTSFMTFIYKTFPANPPTVGATLVSTNPYFYVSGANPLTVTNVLPGSNKIAVAYTTPVSVTALPTLPFTTSFTGTGFTQVYQSGSWYTPGLIPPSYNQVVSNQPFTVYIAPGGTTDYPLNTFITPLSPTQGVLTDFLGLFKTGIQNLEKHDVEVRLYLEPGRNVLTTTAPVNTTAQLTGINNTVLTAPPEYTLSSVNFKIRTFTGAEFPPLSRVEFDNYYTQSQVNPQSGPSQSKFLVNCRDLKQVWAVNQAVFKYISEYALYGSCYMVPSGAGYTAEGNLGRVYKGSFFTHTAESPSFSTLLYTQFWFTNAGLSFPPTNNWVYQINNESVPAHPVHPVRTAQYSREITKANVNNGAMMDYLSFNYSMPIRVDKDTRSEASVFYLNQDYVAQGDITHIFTISESVLEVNGNSIKIIN